MSLQTEKRELDTRISRYMTLLSNLDDPPVNYINDLDYFRGLVQIANQKEIDGLLQTWEAMRPKDARSDHFIKTGVLGDGRVIEFKGLIGLTWDIMMLRGGPTSGNWGHAGRKGKRGGSGRGGGFSRIGVKDGKKAGRKGVKRASRQTRAKDEKQKGGGVKAGSGEIPQSVIGRVKGEVAQAKTKRDKELKQVRNGEIEVEKAKAARSKAQQKYFNSLDKVTPAYEAFLKAGNEDKKRSDEVFSFLNTNPNFLDPKVKAKADKLQKASAKARKKHDRAREEFQKADRINIKNREAYSKADGEFKAISDKHKSNRKTKDIMADYHKETEQASKVLFQHNLNEGKRVRGEMIESEAKRMSEIKRLAYEKSKYEKELDTHHERMQAANFPDNDPRAIAMIDQSFEVSLNVGRISRELSDLTRSQADTYQSMLKVDNPTKIITAPGSQRDPQVIRKDGWKKGRDGFQEIVSDDVVPKGTPVKFARAERSRSFQRGGLNFPEVHMAEFASSGTMVHELGHVAENQNQRLLKRSIEWREKRAGKEEFKPLKDLTGNQGYDDSERAKKDKFFDPYIGKDYGNSASEVFSMGIERMHRDPLGFARDDPDMFDFIYAQSRTP